MLRSIYVVNVAKEISNDYDLSDFNQMKFNEKFKLKKKVERNKICFTRDVVICFHQFDNLQIFLFDNVFCLRPVFSAFDNDEFLF